LRGVAAPQVKAEDVVPGMRALLASLEAEIAALEQARAARGRARAAPRRASASQPQRPLVQRCRAAPR
jgi:hypothetical protein